VANPPRIELLLSRHADTAWMEVVRPWLEGGRGQLARAFVIVATRGQAHGFKQRCLMEGVPLLGVEFLTPGLARQKWRALAAEPRPVLGRELLLLGLRTLIARCLAPLTIADEHWGFWKSLQSDPERALDDFDTLLKGCFRAEDFPLEPLRAIFTELTAWVDGHGAGFAPVEAERAGLAQLPANATRIGGRLLVCGLGAEHWGEFFNVAAFVRRMTDVTVVLPEPAFRGRADSDEKWVELWQSLLGVLAQPVDAPPPVKTCEPVGALWTREPADGATERATVLVGRARADEMVLVADAITERLANGAENIGVIFPKADAAYLRLVALLRAREVPFADLLEGAAMPPVDVQAQRALVSFYKGGARIDDLLEIWPLLRALGAGNDEHVNLTLATVRRACERSFDELHTHALAAHVEHWKEAEPALAEIARKLLPAWPDELTLADALARFEAVCEALSIVEPEGLGPLEAFAQKAGDEVFPVAVVLATLEEFLPSKSPPADRTGKGTFARVTITTRRRAEGLAWSHLFLTEANAGVWPDRGQPSPWLTDEQREELNNRGRFTLGLFTSEHRAALEKESYAQLARDTRSEVVFSAALFDEENPELPLAPNSWVERVLWASGAATEAGGLEEAFAREARVAVDIVKPDESDEKWKAIWDGRRDAERPFDEHFFAGDPAVITPKKWSARRVEQGVQDPAVLWFESVLGVQRVPWEPLVRGRARALGQLAHALLAEALTAGQVGAGGFGPLPSQAEAAERLARALVTKRAGWPADRYWDSFHAELTHACEVLLGRTYEIAPAQAFVAAEWNLPRGATVKCGEGRIEVGGRVDLVLSDRPGWRGATVEILDFKTGGDVKLNAARMARDGRSLQLALYLAAMQALGAASGRVWMVKIEPGGTTSLRMEELDVALMSLTRLEKFIESGRYGALTADRAEYPPYGYTWPLACVPIPATVLEAKFVKTFGREEEDADV
jgi:hypothetical protein